MSNNDTSNTKKGAAKSHTFNKYIVSFGMDAYLFSAAKKLFIAFSAFSTIL